MKRSILSAFFGAAAMAVAQVAEPPVAAPPAAAAPATAPAAGQGAAQKPGGTLGNDLPMFNPGSEVFTWDGKNWNINNNRIFEARFEKYLNAPEESSDEAKQYRTILEMILRYLAPGNASSQNIDLAFKLLPQASRYDIDARLCDSLADAVYTVWQAQRQQSRLASANNVLQYEVMSLEASTRHQATVTEGVKTTRAATQVGGGGGGRRGQQTPQQQAQASPTTQAADAKQAALEVNNWQTRRLAEMVARQKLNDVKREWSEIQAKVEFQALIVQFFLQRRFQHVLMGTRFYRALFSDGDSKLNVGNETRDLFSRSAGMPPTVSTLDAMANEAIRDVREGVSAYEFLLEKNEMASASKRLGEAFTIGEYMPEIRTLPREKKRKALAFTQKAFQLISALEVKDYGAAEKLLAEIAEVAHDFDASKPRAAIDTARRTSDLRLQSARNAAISGDRATLQTELQAAMEIWPLNPTAQEMSKMIFDQGNVQQRALGDFDQLLTQKNFRQIFDDKGRYLAASSQFPERAKQLQDVLEKMQQVEGALMRAQEMSKQSNYAGAWESVERVATTMPDDSKLNQMRADLTTRAPDFVRAVRDAQEHERNGQVGSSLAWYLKAQKLYPASEFAKDGVERLKRQILQEE
jgi:tetratricopeptide (TPR) repeat protein